LFKKDFYITFACVVGQNEKSKRAHTEINKPRKQMLDYFFLFEKHMNKNKEIALENVEFYQSKAI